LFTSGTTGYPKGAMVTHGANIRTNWEWGANVGLRREDRYLLVNPLFHSFGYRAGLLTSLQHRATVYPVRTLVPEDTQQLIQDEKITVMPGAVTMYTTIMDHPSFGTYDLDSVRLAVTGASVVPVPVLQRMRAELGIKDILTAYGLTESCGTATVCPPDASLDRLSTTSGTAIPGTEVQIMNESGELLPPREHGEIVIRGYNLMAGYFEDPEATAKTIDADGWLHTGDVGWLDEDGYLTITDRIKDVITVGGFNVYPAEIERVLLEHPAIGQVAVVGIPDERFQEVAKAFVVCRRGHVVTEEELIAHCKQQLANFKVPREVEIKTELPQTPTGKIQKFLLAEKK
ncbi:MAG: AMP-binding protein, partial [Propionibacterium sp.]|nr:AMP-binding protein [Propionibacterium sp.]